ncbi:MAG: TniB family NTP-binding protein [Paracoccaceae bacterium]
MAKETLPLLAQLIHHDAFATAYTDLEEIISVRDPASGLIVPLLGPTRVGKSALLSLLRRRLSRPATGGLFPTDDFVIGKLAPKPSDRDIYRSVLQAVKAKWRRGEDVADLRKRVFYAIKEIGVQVIAIDECNHCAERGAHLSARAAADHFKTIADETGVTLLLVGLPRFQSILEGNEQMRDRSSNTVFLLPYDWQKENERDAFVGVVVAALDAIAQSRIDLECGFEDVAPRLYGASGGRVPVALRMLKSALLRRKQGESFSLDLLRPVARGMQQFPISPLAFFTDEIPDDVMLIRSFATIMSEAGLAFEADTLDGVQVTWDMRAAS